MEPWEFGRAVRRWRDRVQPAAAGVPVGGRRRAAGLRREELAGLAGISVDYLTRLEQGRATSPSVQGVEALARVACLRRRARPALPIGRARDSWTRRRIVADHTERATHARSPGEHTRRRLRRNVDPRGRQRALRRPDGSDDKLAGNRTEQ